MSDEKPKIIVDEDWKAEVQAEREKLRGGASEPNTGPRDAAASDPSSESSELQDQLPPASLQFLLTTIATQAMVAPGQLPNPITGKSDIRLSQAKHQIDMLAILEQKTVGNRTPDESALLEELLHQLRLAYIMMK